MRVGMSFTTAHTFAPGGSFLNVFSSSVMSPVQSPVMLRTSVASSGIGMDRNGTIVPHTARGAVA